MSQPICECYECTVQVKANVIQCTCSTRATCTMYLKRARSKSRAIKAKVVPSTARRTLDLHAQCMYVHVLRKILVNVIDMLLSYNKDRIIQWHLPCMHHSCSLYIVHYFRPSTLYSPTTYSTCEIRIPIEYKYKNDVLASHFMHPDACDDEFPAFEFELGNWN